MNPLLKKVMFGIGVVGLLGAVGAGLARASEDPRDGPVTSDPGVSEPGFAHNYDVLHRVRLDLAKKLGIDPLEVRLTSLTHAGWDGCLGVVEEDQACTQIFIAGLIATFEANGESFRYHIGGGDFVGPVDPEKADDGVAVDPAMAADRMAILAEYARQELALRLGKDVRDLRIVYVLPALFGDGCLGYVPDNVRCAQLLLPVEGAVVGIAVDGRIVLYSVTVNQVVWHDQENGQTSYEVDEKLVDLQRELREDLARRLGIDVDRAGIASFRFVTWPDGCLGLVRIDATCLAAITEGYLAFLTDDEGRAYRYHGGGDTFVAADFEPGVVGVQEPLAEGGIREALKADLARRLGVTASEIVIAEFRPAVWSDGCLGVIRFDALCSQALVEDGFLAFLQGPDGKLYRYHGGNGTFVAVNFEEGIGGYYDPVG
jgi:hypothetical protein